MPRARINHKLVRVPTRFDIAYDLTYYYPPKLDEEILQKHVGVMLKGSADSKNFAKNLLETLQTKKILTPKQRLALLQREYPNDVRLKAIRACINKPDKRFERAFRTDPQWAYDAEERAVQRAIAAREGDDMDLSKLEAVLNRD